MEDQKKTLGKLKLNQLSKNELEKREMKVLKGGCNSCSEDCYPTTSINSMTLDDHYGGY